MTFTSETKQFNNNKKDIDPTILLSVTGIFWLLAKIISWKAWTTNRAFPVLPVFDFLHAVAGWIHWLLLIVSILLLVVLIIKPNIKGIQVALLIAEVCTCILDQNRLQPWEYQYMLVLLIYIVNSKQKERIASCILLLFIDIYFYSAISKLNTSYLYNTWDYTILNNFLKIPYTIVAQSRLLHYSGYLLTIAELLAAIGLIFKRTRKPSAIFLIITHVFILLLLGPFGINFNKVVWPWNILMIFSLYIIAINKNEIQFGYVVKGANKIIILCAGFLPLLYYAGYWDNYLSFRLYAGDTPYMIICTSKQQADKEMQQYLSKNTFPDICNGDAVLKINSWSYSEMNVTPSPMIRNYKKIKEQWLLKHPDSKDKFFIYYVVKGRLDVKEME